MEHVNDCCFRDIYKGGLWEEDLDVCALSSQMEVITMPNMTEKNIRTRNNNPGKRLAANGSVS